MEVDKIKLRSAELMKEVEKVEGEINGNMVSQFHVNNIGTQAANLIYSTAGPKSAYAEGLKTAQKIKHPAEQFFAVVGVIQAFNVDANKGYLINIRHEVEAVIVSEIITQSRKLLGTKGIHPAASIIVSCAGVEEFLRAWCENKGINIPKRQRSISKYAQELRAIKEISLPMERRVQAWADYRNSAAHGDDWESITKSIAETVVSEIEKFIIDNQKIVGA